MDRVIPEPWFLTDTDPSAALLCIPIPSFFVKATSHDRSLIKNPFSIGMIWIFVKKQVE
jgi:hypothetical protein